MDKAVNIVINIIFTAIRCFLFRGYENKIVMVLWLYSLITNEDVRTDEYTKKTNDIKSPITRNVLSKVSFVCAGSVMLSTKDTVINKILKIIAVSENIVFSLVLI